jgi:hypothetical protein
MELDGIINAIINYARDPEYVVFLIFPIHTTLQSEMNDDHLYRDPEYSWDEYIRSSPSGRWGKLRPVYASK